jgi:hypothetical protein
VAHVTESDALDRIAAVAADLAGADPRAAAWALAHCAQSIEYSISGYPRLRSSLFRATIGPMVKRKFLRASVMKHDTTAPVAGAPELPAELTLGDARARLAAAIAAFRAHAGALAPHLAYGACTRDEYARLHLLHVEDHVRAIRAR